MSDWIKDLRHWRGRMLTEEEMDLLCDAMEALVWAQQIIHEQPGLVYGWQHYDEEQMERYRAMRSALTALKTEVEK